MRLVLLIEVEEPGLAESLAEKLHNMLGVEVETVKTSLRNVERAFDSLRQQFNASVLLEIVGEGGDYTLLLTDKDLFVPGLNFVFGYAPGRKAVVSTRRLDPERYGEGRDRKLYFSRIVKEVVHEFGHMLGLGHCRTAGCVMNFSNSVYDVDRKQEVFCHKCMGRLSAALSR
ncbi:MAG: archaemetzincin family Zn-dependent metalloprotease [Candidatus Caldarchaeum sp.]